jgi:NAD-dependent SIR2 family protein deacetylase
MTMAFADKSLTCRECGNAFVWTAGEQEFYQQKGLLHEPQRCPDCRKKAKAERAATGRLAARLTLRSQHAR